MSTSEIRNLRPEDIGAVAALFQRAFRDPGTTPPAALEAYLSSLFLDHPWHDPDIVSRVYVGDSGRVEGFLGVHPARFRLGERILRVAVAGSLTVANFARNPTAGARLLRALSQGPQDLTISETANLVSQRLWEAIGGRASPLHSLEWLRLLRPAASALALLPRPGWAKALLRPLARAGDRLTGRLGKPYLRPDIAAALPAAGRDADDARLAEAIETLSRRFPLRPDWSAQTLRWFLAQASRKELYGRPVRRVVEGRDGRTIGCYLYHLPPDGIARVLQAVAAPGAEDAVLDDLLTGADRAGAAAIRGRTDPTLMNALMKRRCLFVPRAALVVQTREPELRAAIESGEALVTGLAGESWSRLIGGRFD